MVEEEEEKEVTDAVEEVKDDVKFRDVLVGEDEILRLLEYGVDDVKYKDVDEEFVEVCTVVALAE